MIEDNEFVLIQIDKIPENSASFYLSESISKIFSVNGWTINNLGFFPFAPINGAILNGLIYKSFI